MGHCTPTGIEPRAYDDDDDDDDTVFSICTVRICDQMRRDLCSFVPSENELLVNFYIRNVKW